MHHVRICIIMYVKKLSEHQLYTYSPSTYASSHSTIYYLLNASFMPGKLSTPHICSLTATIPNDCSKVLGYQGE